MEIRDEARRESSVEQGKLKSYVIGVRELDKLIGEISGPYTVLISGHPGAGKTTLASTICYNNILLGHKCLYITVYEDKEKLFKTTDRLGIYLSKCEAMGSFRFIRIPISMDTTAILETVSKSLSEGFNVIVIDTVTSLLEAAGSDIERRATLLNYFYQLPLLNNGLLVLVSELPYGSEVSSYATAEFVADAVIVLKHRIEDGFLVRLIEMRKLRGKPQNLVEIPFIIVENRGIVVHVPILLEELPPEKEELDLPCKVIGEKLGHIHRDFYINMFYPPEVNYGREIFIIILATLVKYNMRGLLISYVSSPHTIKDLIVKELASHGIPSEHAERIVNNYLAIKGINPYAQSIYELALKELELIEKVKPGVVIFHGSHVLKTRSYRKFFMELYNQILNLKHKGIITIRISNCIDEKRCFEEASISDITLVVDRYVGKDSVQFNVISYRRFKNPVIITSEDVSRCIEESIEIIKQAT